MARRDYSADISVLYTIGKDFAFDWMEKHPGATQAVLVEAILADQKILPPGIARTTADKVAARVFQVRFEHWCGIFVEEVVKTGVARDYVLKDIKSNSGFYNALFNKGAAPEQVAGEFQLGSNDLY